MLAILIFIGIPSLIVLARFLPYLKFRISKAVYRFILTQFIFLFLIFISTILLSSYHLYWRGYRSSSFIFIGFSLATIIFYWSHPIDKVPGFLTFGSAILSFLLSGLALFLVLEIIYDYDKQLIYNDRKYRLEHTNRGFMSIEVLPKLFVKKGLVEKMYVLDSTYDDFNYGSFTEKEIPGEKIKRIEINEVKDSASAHPLRL
jgi:hypothetical protein